MPEQLSPIKYQKPYWAFHFHIETPEHGFDGLPDSDPADPELGDPCGEVDSGGGTSDAGLPEARDGSPLADHADDGPPDDRCGDTLDGARLLDIRITLLDLALDLLENFDELLENPIIEACDDLPLDNDEALEEDDILILLLDDRLDDLLLGDELLLLSTRQQHQP